MMQKPESLGTLPAYATLSDVEAAHIKDAGLYHQLVDEVTAWQDWYTKQKALAAK